MVVFKYMVDLLAHCYFIWAGPKLENIYVRG